MIRPGDTVALYDGSTVVVQAVRCNKCDRRVAHENCERWLKVGETRWVSETSCPRGT